MKDQEIYQKLGELLWSIMNENAHIIFCEGYIYSDAKSYSFEWIESNNRIGWFDFDTIPHEIGDEIINLMEKLNSSEIFKEKWTHFKISLTEEGKFNIEFAYIPEDDRWPGLYMKAVSDLKEEELDEYNIPRDEWEKRVMLKEQNKK
ncbi:immunity protein YezG family protein [Acinetobacter nosocomialis]|uniref:immunity protein YezG family protein n=1 Tax=Acinetobacter nosocomialis TaxID=106654 RepID=UPI003AF654F8